ncbi:MAG: hypothetical protein LC687_06620 [Actinobacteria bacterium]|nr:hypothetical protein [Actinomycetota bacterium]
MNKKDATLILVVVIISAGLSFFLSASLFGDPETNPIEVETVETITSEFIEPGDRYFNENSINPTRLITIGDGGDNTSPFGQAEED